MKFLILSLLLVILTGCAANKPGTSTDAQKQPASKNAIHSQKIIGLLQESRKANNSAAINKLVKKVRRDTENPELIYTLAYEHMQNAQKNKSVAEHDLAISYFNDVLDTVPGNQSTLLSLYYIYYNDTLRNYSPTSFENAKAIFLQVPESGRGDMNPPSLAKYALMATWQESQHQPNHQQLREILLNAMQEHPRNDIAYIELAKLYSEDHYFTLALATLKLGAENIHDSVELYKAIGLTYEQRAEANGCNYEHSSDIANASKYYKLAIPLKPTEQSLHYNLSRTLFDLNLNNLALYEADIALELEEGKTDFAIAAQNYSMLGNNKKANALLHRAMDNGYTMSETGYHEIFMNEGDWKTAAKGFSAYINSRTSYSVYDLIKSDIIAQQSQEKPWLVNKKISLNSDWEENLFKYWDTEITADELKKKAITSCEKTEYYFYTGYQDYRDGKIELAKSKFSAALSQNTYRFIERPLARYFLQK